MRRFLLLLCLAFAPLAGAQVLDDVDVAREGAANARITIRFAVRVQYLRTATNAKKDLVQIFFRITQPEEDGRTLEEFRRPPTNGLVPPFTVTYPILPRGDVRRLDVQFEKPVAVTVRQGPDNRAILVIAPALAGAPAAPAAAPATTPPGAQAASPSLPVQATDAAADAELRSRAAALLGQARAALAAERTDEAIDLLNQLLNLPPTGPTREAQELIGVAREKRGEPDKARVEYELFLKLYPTGADSQRVRTRLAALGGPAAATPAPVPGVAAAPSEPRPARWRAWGSVSQYYYGGQSKIDTTITTITPATNATTIDTLSLTASDQRALVTNVDLNGRYTSDTWDDRMVVRDTHSLSFLKEQPNRNRLVSAYAEAVHLPSQTMVRLGRQSSTFGGVLGRFDGLTASNFGFAPRMRANVVVGRPADRLGDLDPLFYGASLDADSITEHVSGTVYAIQQRLKGTTDRTAIGAEIRYFDTDRSLVSLTDFDVTFRALNVAMVQGTWQLPGGASLNFLGDYRRSPSLQLSNALLTGRNLTLSQYLETFGESQARDDARAITPISKVFYAGVTVPISPRLQVGADLRVSSLSGTPEVGLLPATLSTGNVYTYSVQVIGSSLFGKNDVMVFNASYLTGTLSKGLSAGLTERVQLGELWVFEPSLRYYRQNSSNDVHLARISPGVKLSYKVRERMQLEGEATWERTHTTGPSLDDTTTRLFYFVGYRWDF